MKGIQSPECTHVKLFYGKSSGEIHGYFLPFTDKALQDAASANIPMPALEPFCHTGAFGYLSPFLKLVIPSSCDQLSLLQLNIPVAGSAFGIRCFETVCNFRPPLERKRIRAVF